LTTAHLRLNRGAPLDADEIERRRQAKLGPTLSERGARTVRRAPAALFQQARSRRAA